MKSRSSRHASEAVEWKLNKLGGKVAFGIEVTFRQKMVNFFEFVREQQH